MMVRCDNRNAPLGPGAWTVPAVLVLALFGACGRGGLTREALREAESQWRSHAVPSYSIEVSVSESEGARRRVRLQVRDGQIVRATLSQADAAEERAVVDAVARPYTVEGLFQTLDEEMTAAKRRYVRASFDPELGFPERIELGPLRGAPVATRWVLRVESFRAASAVDE